MVNGRIKGSGFEKEICDQLSRWWTDGRRDDVFYKSQGSGNRASARAKRGKRTAHQHGDVCCSDPEGAALTDLFNIEIKRGYADANIHETLDRSPRAVVGWFEYWIAKADYECRQAGTFAWLLITRRDRRLPMVWMPKYVADVMMGDLEVMVPPWIVTGVTIRGFLKSELNDSMVVYGTSLGNFLGTVTRQRIEELAKLA